MQFEEIPSARKITKGENQLLTLVPLSSFICCPFLGNQHKILAKKRTMGILLLPQNITIISHFDRVRKVIAAHTSYVQKSSVFSTQLVPQHHAPLTVVDEESFQNTTEAFCKHKEMYPFCYSFPIYSNTQYILYYIALPY